MWISTLQLQSVVLNWNWREDWFIQFLYSIYAIPPIFTSHTNIISYDVNDVYRTSLLEWSQFWLAMGNWLLFPFGFKQNIADNIENSCFLTVSFLWIFWTYHHIPLALSSTWFLLDTSQKWSPKHCFDLMLKDFTFIERYSYVPFRMSDTKIANKFFFVCVFQTMYFRRNFW